ncbi:glycosyltransferase family 2 protein [Lelliottia amnigena]|uniref:Glycosyltransferase family 2 protein n=1 Tax=Lelliottia amnigena TaxID=61646 RepID=A0ABU7UDC8_LELAM
MRVNLSIVSHGHFEIIKKIGSLEKLCGKEWVSICVVDNLCEYGFEEWCNELGINYLKNKTKCGFGENNNKAFNFFYKNECGCESFFLVVNPDVLVLPEQLEKLYNFVRNENIDFACINLFKDNNLSVYDNSIRKYPSLTDFLTSFIFSKNKTIIDKSTIFEPITVDWASGSFLLFKPSLYKKLYGFDERYFMYCEDIDICMRANFICGSKLVYIPSITAIHYAAHNNRKILSKHFFWHMKSMLRYLYRKNYIILKNKISKK